MFADMCEENKSRSYWLCNFLHLSVSSLSLKPHVLSKSPVYFNYEHYSCFLCEEHRTRTVRKEVRETNPLKLLIFRGTYVECTRYNLDMQRVGNKKKRVYVLVRAYAFLYSQPLEVYSFIYIRE